MSVRQTLKPLYLWLRKLWLKIRRSRTAFASARLSRGTREQDNQLLALALQRLEEQGSIEFVGEYGDELATFIPFVAWLKANNHLIGRKVITYAGMRPYYYFLADGEYAEKKSDRHWLRPAERKWPGSTTASVRAAPWHVYPDYRTHFAVSSVVYDRPVLFIQNKFAVEWGVGPINYLPLTFLDWVLHQAAERFHVVYSRPGITHDPLSYSRDHSSYCDYPDRQVLKEHPAVEVLEEKCLESNLDYNLFKLQLLAKCHHFISVQGGGAHLLSCYSNSILLVYHQEGSEYPHAYQSGPYKYLSTPPPLLMTARNRRALTNGAKVLLSTQVNEQGVTVENSFLSILEELRL